MDNMWVQQRTKAARNWLGASVEYLPRNRANEAIRAGLAANQHVTSNPLCDPEYEREPKPEPEPILNQNQSQNPVALLLGTGNDHFAQPTTAEQTFFTWFGRDQPASQPAGQK